MTSPYPSSEPPRGKTGLIVGGVIGAVVLVAALVVVVVFVGGSGGGQDNGASGEDGKASDEAASGYEVPVKPCESIESDVEELGVNGSLGGNKHTHSDGSVSGTCLGKLYKSADENGGHARIYIDVYLDETGDSAKYDEFVDEKLDGFETSDLSGAWEKGTVGTHSTVSSEEVGVVVHDENVDIAFVITNHDDVGISDPEGVLTSLMEKLLDDLKA